MCDSYTGIENIDQTINQNAIKASVDEEIIVDKKICNDITE